MNSCVLMVEIIQDPQLRFTPESQTPIAEMLVAFSALKAEDPPGTIKVIGWGNLGQEIASSYKTGDHLIIEGRLGMNTIERPEGFKEKRAELTASRIHRLEAADSPSLSSRMATPATPSPATSNVVAMTGRKQVPVPSGRTSNRPLKTEEPMIDISPVQPYENTPIPSTQQSPTFSTSGYESNYTEPELDSADEDDIPF